MDVDDSTLELCLATALIATNLLSLMHTRNMKKKKKARRHWVKPWMARKSKNVFNNLLKEMYLEDQQAFYDYHRMHRKNFAELLELVSPLIKKQDTKMRKAVSPAQRLSITLRYLATGESRRSLEFQYRTSHCLISSIIPETCDAIFTSLKNDYLKLPTSSEEWQQVARMWEGAPCGFEGIQGVGRGHSNDAKNVRDNLKNYFISNGKVPWQDRMALYH
ncbi:hypothetical protein Pmani_007505 [Petrolisthes manimaculis]|uniref:Uncharacterized protein n=1 Tax=Petrolisthes manimaculis TaxID=1843537 RepID=A0AAE1Q7S3_9EUCA|nr:hypothetical protein Pmani_007960 [Petrolisthes manimaculis]KAK4321708.1 hypothetical protein Pmani_007505 [Petrolisthes manimaculis]